MDFIKFKNAKDSLLGQNLVLKVGIIAMVVTNIYLVHTVVKKTDSQRTVFIPPQNTYKEFWVNGNTVSNSYLTMMGNFVSHNILNVSTKNAEMLMGNILPLVASSSFTEVKKELQRMYNFLKDNQMSRVFYLSFVDTSTPNKLIVKGSISDFVSSQALRTKQINLEIDYNIEFGRFYIVNLSLKGL